MLLGIPLSDLRLDASGIPIIDNIEESFSVTVDKTGITMAADVSILDKLLKVLGAPLPLFDAVNLDVHVPTENLFRDLMLGRTLELDPTRDWRGSLGGVVSFGVGGLGFDIGNVAGLVFPAVGAAADPTKPREGIPEDHPLITRVQIVTAATTTIANDRIPVTQEDFLTMREYGGILLGGRLTVPEFVSDPIRWYQSLANEVGTDLAMCSTHANLLDCFMQLESDEYVEFFSALASAGGTIGGALKSGVQLAEVQVYVPNVFQEISELILPPDPATIADAFTVLKDKAYNVFDVLTDGQGNLQTDLETLYNNQVFDSRNSLAQLQGQFDVLKNKLLDTAYVRGVVGSGAGGNSPAKKLFGIDFGGAMIDVDDGVLVTTGFFPSLAAGQSPEEHSGLQFEARIEVQTDPDVADYPRAGASTRFSLSPSDNDPQLLTDFFNQSGLANTSLVGRGAEIFARAGDWLLSGVIPQNALDIELFAYSPGYDPEAVEANFTRQLVKRKGGVGLSAAAELSNSFGSLEGDIDLALIADPDAPAGVAFTGSFKGAATFTLPGLPTFVLPEVTGQVSPEGCVEVRLAAGVGPVPNSLSTHFALAAGACDAHIVLSDVTVPEPAANGQTTVQVPVRIEQVPPWSDGTLKLLYELKGDAIYGVDYGIPNGSGGIVSPSSVSAWRTGELLFTASDVQVDGNGVRYAEKLISFVILGDGNQPAGTGATEGTKRIVVDFFPPSNPPGIDFALDNDKSLVNIIDTDFIVPDRPANAEIFYDFDHPSARNAFSAAPDATSQLEYSTAVSSFSATNADGSLLVTTGLLDTSDAQAPGVAIQQPLNSSVPPDDSGFDHGFEFSATFDRLFAPNYLEFWDKPAQALYGESPSFSGGGVISALPTYDEQWEVYALIDGREPVLLDTSELITVTTNSVPNAHPDLIGWRKLHVDIGERLREPTPTEGAFSFGPRPYFSSDRTVTFRFVPKSTGIPSVGQILSGQLRRRIDNVALFGNSQQQGGSFGGTDLSFDEFANGRIDFNIVEGPGVIEIVFDPADPTISNPAPFDDMPAHISVVGGDATTVLSISVNGRDSSWGVLDLGNITIGSGLHTLDLSNAGEIRGNFRSTAAIANLHVDRFVEGSFDMGGLASSSMNFVADRPVGNGSESGFSLSFPGTINATLAGISGGRVRAVLGPTTSTSDVMASIELQAGFSSMDVVGNLTLDQLTTGLAAGTNNGTSGSIQVSRGELNILRGRIDGDLDRITLTGGGLTIQNFVARNVTSITTSTDKDSTAAADLQGDLDVNSIGAVNAHGGDITVTLVTRDASQSNLRMQASRDANGRGGRIISRNSLHIAGGIEAIRAQEIDINLVAGGPVQSIVVADGSMGEFRGNVKAARIGNIVINGNAELMLATTDGISELSGAAAVEALTIRGGDLLGGLLRTQQGTSIGAINIEALEGNGGNIQGLLRVESDLSSLIAGRRRRSH